MAVNQIQIFCWQSSWNCTNELKSSTFMFLFWIVSVNSWAAENLKFAWTCEFLKTKVLNVENNIGSNLSMFVKLNQTYERASDVLSMIWTEDFKWKNIRNIRYSPKCPCSLSPNLSSLGHLFASFWIDWTSSMEYSMTWRVRIDNLKCMERWFYSKFR